VRLVIERRSRVPHFPLTADLAGVLAAAQPERASAHGWDATSSGAGAAMARFVSSLRRRVSRWRAWRGEEAAPARVRST
jgi:hypothetical protein